MHPILQQLHHIPLALHDHVCTKLQELLESGITELWISNLVVAKKKSGGLYVCVDLQAVNKAIIPDMFPLPTAEEQTTQFHGSTIFSHNPYVQFQLTSFLGMKAYYLCFLPQYCIKNIPLNELPKKDP